MLLYDQWVITWYFMETEFNKYFPFVLTVFDPSIEDSEEYKKVHQEYKATVSIYKNCETCIN